MEVPKSRANLDWWQGQAQSPPPPVFPDVRAWFQRVLSCSRRNIRNAYPATWRDLRRSMFLLLDPQRPRRVLRTTNGRSVQPKRGLLCGKEHERNC